MTLAVLPAPRARLALALAGWSGLILCESLAQVALKLAGTRLADVAPGRAWLLAALGEPWAWIGAVGYVGSFAAWMTILDRLPLSRSFPLTAIVYVAVALASLVLFHEPVGVLRGAGIALIVAGVVVIGREEGDA